MTDSRAYQVFVTPKGKQVIEQSIFLFQEVEREMFQGFSDEQMEQLSEFFGQMYRNLNEKAMDQHNADAK